MRKKACKFQDSIIYKLGWSEEEFYVFYWNILNMKLAHNIKLTKQEMRDFVDIMGTDAVKYKGSNK